MTYDDASWISGIPHFTAKGDVERRGDRDLPPPGSSEITSQIALFETEQARGFDRNFTVPMVFEFDGTPVIWEFFTYARVLENAPWYQFHNDTTTYHCFGRTASALANEAPRHFMLSHSAPVQKAIPGIFEYFTGLPASLVKSQSTEVVHVRSNSTFEEVKSNRRIFDNSYKAIVQALSKWSNVSVVRVHQKYLRYDYYSPVEGTWSDPAENVTWKGENGTTVDFLTEEEKTAWLNNLPIQGGLSLNEAYAPSNKNDVDVSKVFLDPITQTFTYPDDLSVTPETLANALFPGDFPLYVRYRDTLF